MSQSNPQASTVSVNAIDPEFNALGDTKRFANLASGGPGAVAAQGNTVWVAPSFGLLTRLDSAGRVLQRIDPNSGPAAIALGAGATWLVDTEGDNVIRVDSTGVLTPIAVGNGPTAIAVGEGGVWVVDSRDDAVVRIDLATLSVTDTIAVGRSPAGVAVGAGSVWVANAGDGTIMRIDPRTKKVQATIAVGGSPQAITVADGRVWVTVDAQTIKPTDPISGGGTLRMESEQDVDSMDPAIVYGGLSWQLLYLTCAKLLNTRRQFCVLAHICAVRAHRAPRANNISATLRGGSLTRGPNHRAGQHEGRTRSVRPIAEDDTLLDHHIEELLGTFGDVGRMGEHGPDAEERFE